MPDLFTHTDSDGDYTRLVKHSAINKLRMEIGGSNRTPQQADLTPDAAHDLGCTLIVEADRARRGAGQNPMKDFTAKQLLDELNTRLP